MHQTTVRDYFLHQRGRWARGRVFTEPVARWRVLRDELSQTRKK